MTLAPRTHPLLRSSFPLLRRCSVHCGERLGHALANELVPFADGAADQRRRSTEEKYYSAKTEEEHHHSRDLHYIYCSLYSWGSS